MPTRSFAFFLLSIAFSSFTANEGNNKNAFLEFVGKLMKRNGGRLVLHVMLGDLCTRSMRALEMHFMQMICLFTSLSSLHNITRSFHFQDQFITIAWNRWKQFNEAERGSCIKSDFLLTHQALKCGNWNFMMFLISLLQRKISGEQLIRQFVFIALAIGIGRWRCITQSLLLINPLTNNVETKLNED